MQGNLSKNVRYAAPAPLLALALLLSGCSSSAINEEEIAEVAADTFEENVGVRPVIDCGQDDIELEVGTSKACEHRIPGDSDVYGAIVTVEEVDGADLTVSTVFVESIDPEAH